MPGIIYFGKVTLCKLMQSQCNMQVAQSLLKVVFSFNQCGLLFTRIVVNWEKFKISTADCKQQMFSCPKEIIRFTFYSRLEVFSNKYVEMVLNTELCAA